METQCECKEGWECEVCNQKYCEDCDNDRCEWCEHMRGEQVVCPHCSTTVFLNDQTLCAECVYFGIEDKEIVFCKTCDDFICTIDDNDCAHHDIETNEIDVLVKCKELWPKLGIFSLFNPEKK